MTLELFQITGYAPPHTPILGPRVFTVSGNKKQCTSAGKAFVKANTWNSNKFIGTLAWKWK